MKNIRTFQGSSTAYDEYVMEVANGIDYILKPFIKVTPVAAVSKAATLKQTRGTAETHHLYPQYVPKGKKSFLVFKDNKYTVIGVEQIAFFYVRGEQPVIVTFEGTEYIASQSLDTTSSQLSPAQFYRINRQYLINFDAVHEVERYFARKLLVHLKTATPEQIIIGKNKAPEFLQWLDNR
ncbi:LytTR family transcriptional regulator [Chitinophaga filiformis]|uniref:LytR/AlgR family response regulator transcription factor n=1 Tax=Chitinophaga filiformis TaxID=104663 RepID=UPI001F15DABD|nr:LytTR family DNA-binding domain-containing protein [Chitinophaga filiformis]MCF6406449.1 LytTR family transcriptional regulator [Chitinophaga filiformis]